MTAEKKTEIPEPGKEDMKEFNNPRKERLAYVTLNELGFEWLGHAWLPRAGQTKTLESRIRELEAEAVRLLREANRKISAFDPVDKKIVEFLSHVDGDGGK